MVGGVLDFKASTARLADAYRVTSAGADIRDLTEVRVALETSQPHVIGHPAWKTPALRFRMRGELGLEAGAAQVLVTQL